MSDRGGNTVGDKLSVVTCREFWNEDICFAGTTELFDGSTYPVGPYMTLEIDLINGSGYANGADVPQYLRCRPVRVRFLTAGKTLWDILSGEFGKCV